jgi:transcriptional regulator with XRE-family HTH domain
MDKRVEPKVRAQIRAARRRPTFIRQWRKHRGLTLERLADRVEMSVGNLSQIERGTYAYNQDTLEALAYALDCEPADLLVRNPADPDAPWSIWDQLKPVQKKQAIRLLRALVDDEAA